MNKYYATVTIKVLVNAEDKDEARALLDSLLVASTDNIDEDPDASALEGYYTITDVK